MNCREAGRELSGSGNWSVLADERCSRDVSSRGLFRVGAGDDRVRVGAELGALRSARATRTPACPTFAVKRSSDDRDAADVTEVRAGEAAAGIDQQDDAVPWKRRRRSAKPGRTGRLKPRRSSRRRRCQLCRAWRDEQFATVAQSCSSHSGVRTCSRWSPSGQSSVDASVQGRELDSRLDTRLDASFDGAKYRAGEHEVAQRRGGVGPHARVHVGRRPAL